MTDIAEIAKFVIAKIEHQPFAQFWFSDDPITRSRFVSPVIFGYL